MPTVHCIPSILIFSGALNGARLSLLRRENKNDPGADMWELEPPVK